MAEYLVTLSLLIMILLVVRGLFRKSISPTVMYALWLVVVVRLCLPFSLFQVEVDLPAWQETIPQEQQGHQGAADPGIDPDTITPPTSGAPSMPDTPSVIIPTTPSLPSVPTVPAIPENPTVPGEDSLPDIPHIPDVPVTPEVPPAPPAPIDWMRVAVTVWIAGSSVLALWFAVTGIVYHHRLITHRTLYKTLRKTKVYLTEDESAPCLAGVVPAIYIPPVEMDEDARAFIVLHEYMHLRHGDHVWALVRILALIVHWWNPLVWAAVILSKRDAELACDHAVAAQLNRENRLEYARILLDTIPQKHRYAVGLGSAPMKERILRLTKTQKNRILCVVLAVIITAAAVGCSFVHLTEKESPEEPPAFDFDLDTLCRHIADGDLSALDLFDASNEEFLQGQFNALHAYYSGTAEKAGGDWEAMPEGGVALPGEFSLKNCEKFEYSTASQTPVVLRYDVGDYWLYAAFTLLDVGTTGDVSEILWHLSEAWFIPQSDAVEASVADLAEWKVYSYFQNVGYTEWKTLKFYNQVTGESDYFSAAAGIKITSLQYSGGKVFVECDSHGFLIFDLTGGLYECLSTNKDTYIAYKNEYGAYIPGSGRWLSDSRLQARGEKGIFTVTVLDGEYSLADASLSESEILEIWRYNVGNAQKNNNAPQYHVPYGKLLNDVGSHVLDLFVMKGQAYLEARQAYDEEAATVPWLVYMIRALDVSREEITSALQKDYVPYTDAIVDALFSEDDGRINETFHSPLAICHEGKVYTAYDLSLKITDVDSEEQKAFVRSIPKEDIIALIRAIQARDAMHGVVTPGEIVKLIYRLKDITLTAPGDEYAYGSYCYVHGMAYHSYPSALTDALDRDAFNAWQEEAQWHTRENGCPFPQSNIYEFIHHFNIPKSRFVELYNERTIDDDYPIDLLYGGTAEAVDAYYRTSDPEKELESIKWANLRELKMHINAYIRDELHIQMKTSHCSLAELMYVAGIKAEELSSYYSKGHAVSPENRYDTIFDYDPAAIGYTTDASFEKVLARYTAYYLDCAICGLTPYDTPYDRQVSEMQNGSFTDIPLPDNFAEFYHEAERVYAYFAWQPWVYNTSDSFTEGGLEYCAVNLQGVTTLAGLRSLCEKYFDKELTEELMARKVTDQNDLFVERDGKLYRYFERHQPFMYDHGKNYTMDIVSEKNGEYGVRIQAVKKGGMYTIPAEVRCAYTVGENGEIRFTSFDLMAQALLDEFINQGAPGFDPGNGPFYIPVSSARFLFHHSINGTNDHLYFCSRYDGADDFPPKDFVIYHTVTGDSVGEIPAELPADLKYDSVCPVLATSNGDSQHCEFVLRLTDRDMVFYVSFDNVGSIHPLTFTYRGKLSEDRVNELKQAYPEQFGKAERFFRLDTLYEYKNKNPGSSLVYEGYTVQYELPHPTYEGQTFDFHIHLPQINDDSRYVDEWNLNLVYEYNTAYEEYIRNSAFGLNRNFYAEIRYETVTTGDVVTIYILNSCGVLNSGDARRSYDIYHYDTKGKRFLTTNEFLAYYAKGQFASSSVADIVAFMNEHAFTTDEVGTPIPLKEENIQGVIPSVFGDGKFDVVYQGYSMEGKFATRMLFSPYPTYGNPHRYTYRLTYHDYTDCHTAEMNGQPAGYRLLICQRSAGKFDVSWYIDRLFLEDIAEPPESYPLGEYGGYYTPVNQDAYGNMFIVVDHKTDAGQLQAWIPFDQPGTAQDYYRGVLLGYFNYDRLFGGNAAVEKSVGGMIADVLDAYRNGKDPNELLPASETKFTPYPAKSVRANPVDEEIRAILDAATVDEEGIIRLRVDLGEGYILELPMDLGIFGESYQAYFTGIYFIKPQKVTTQGPFVGYVADKTTPWIDLYTGKNGTYVGRIPYEIFHDWVATDRDKDTWTPGWMGEYVCFYYAEFGDFRWAAAHLRDTVLGSGRKNVATSADGGKTWDIGSTRDNYGGNHVVGMGFATDKIAFISYDPYNEHDGADGPVISRTTDGGKTWKLLEISLPDSLGGQKLIAGIPFYDGDLLRYPVWLNPSHGSREGEPMYLISRDKGMTWEWEKDSTSGTASLSGVLSCILRGEDAFYDTAAKRRVFLTDWLKTNEMFVSKYSVIDLNGDGASELVLWLNRGTNEYVGFLVLYDKNTTVYAHLLYYRQFSNLKKDGTFGFSGGVSNHGIGRIDFEGDKYTIRSLAYCESADNQNVSYFVDNKAVSKAAFEAYQSAQNSKPGAIWVEHSIEPAPGYKQYTPAIDIDTAKLDYIKPMAMYGESQPGANFDRTANIYPGTGFEGYADGVGYITFGVCNDRKSPDYVSRYYTYRVTSAGGYIISVEEAETITRDIVLKKGKPYTGSLEGQHTCVVNNRYYGIAISGDTISASVGRYQTDAGGTGKGTYTYDPATGKMTITMITKYHDGNGNILANPPKTVTGKLYEYGDMVHFLYDDEKATPLPLSFPKINAFPPDRTDFIFDDLAGEWYHSFRDAAGDQFYCLTLDPETQQIRFDHGFYDGSYAARYAGTYRVDYNRIIHATLQDNNNPSGGEMKFVFSMGYSMGRDETGVMRTTINITPQVCDMENYRSMLGRYFGFKREKATAEELTELAEQYSFVMSAYEKAAEAASWFRTASLVEAGEADGKDSIEYDGRRYYRVTKFDTYADLRQYLEEWFSASLVDQLLNDQSVASYISHDGKLYATPGMVPQNIRLGERYCSGGKVKDDWYSLDVTVEVLDTKDLTTVLAYQSFQFDYQYKNGKWVFIQFPHIQ